jgi:hypothetical protein
MQQQLYFLFLFFCLSISTSLSAQESNTFILGKISDKISEEGVESALVFEKTEQIGVESDQFGFYQLSVPPNKPLTIIIRRVGYDQATIKLNAIQSASS